MFTERFDVICIRMVSKLMAHATEEIASLFFVDKGVFRNASATRVCSLVAKSSAKRKQNR